MRYPATNLTGFSAFVGFFMTYVIVNVHPSCWVPNSVNYAGSMSFELRTNETNTPFLRVSVKNGTDDAGYITRPLFNGSSSDVDLQTFIHKLEVRLHIIAFPLMASYISFTLVPLSLAVRSENTFSLVFRLRKQLNATM